MATLNYSFFGHNLNADFHDIFFQVSERLDLEMMSHFDIQTQIETLPFMEVMPSSSS